MVGALAGEIRPVLFGVDELVHRAVDVEQVHLCLLGLAVNGGPPAQNAAQRLNALADARSGSDADPHIGLRDVDPLDEGLHRYQHLYPPGTERGERLLTLAVRQSRVLQRHRDPRL